VPEPTVIQEGIRRFLAERCHVPLHELSGATRFEEDLGLDSFDLVELLIAVEDAYGVVVTDVEAAGLPTVGQAAAFIAART
jgi:acyl carrier protein